MPKDDADYQKHIRERTEEPPEFLHKYVTMETARLILGSGKMRFQSPIRYNDPFDSQWDPFWSLNTEEAQTSHRQLLRTAIKEESSWPSDISPQSRHALQWIQKEILSHSAENRHDAQVQLIADATNASCANRTLRENLTDLRRRLRVLCLSEVQKSVVMWSHYATEHRGVVLTFKSNNLRVNDKAAWHRIQYQSDLPELLNPDQCHRFFVFGQRPFELQGDPILPFVIKSGDWKHEKEWRLIYTVGHEALGDYDDTHINPNSLVKLTMGCRTDRSAFHDLYTLARAWNTDIKLQEAFMPLGSLQLKLRDLDPITL